MAHSTIVYRIGVFYIVQLWRGIEVCDLKIERSNFSTNNFFKCANLGMYNYFSWLGDGSAVADHC